MFRLSYKTAEISRSCVQKTNFRARSYFRGDKKAGELAAAPRKKMKQSSEENAGGHNSRVFISSDVSVARTYVRESNLVDRGRRVFRGFPSGFRFAFAGSICRGARDPRSCFSALSLALAIARCGSLPESMTELSPPSSPSTIHEPGIVHILARCLRSPNNPASSTSVQRFSANSSPDDALSAACLSCRSRLMSQEFRAFYRQQRDAPSATGFEHAVAF